MAAGFPLQLGLDNPQFIEEMIDPDLDDMSIVDHPATDRDLSFFKRVARAVGAGKAKTMSVKQDEIPLEMEEPPAIEPSSVVEIPATPKPWPFSRCIEAAGDLGLGRDEAIAACQLVVQEYGTPDDPETILVPDGAKPESLLAISAVAGGLAKPEGVEGSSEEKRAKFRMALPADFKATGVQKREEGAVGRHWLRKFKCFLGMDQPRPVAELEAQQLERKVSELSTEQSKTKEDLREFARVMHEDNREWQRIFAASLGIQMPERTEPSAPASPIAAQPLAPPAVAVPEEGKSVPVAPAAKDADPETQALLDRCAALEVENAEYRARDESVAALMAEAAAAVAPPEGAQPQAPAAAVAASAPKYARRAGVDPTVPGKKSAGGPEMAFSTYLGVPIPKADRDAFSVVRR